MGSDSTPIARLQKISAIADATAIDGRLFQMLSGGSGVFTRNLVNMHWIAPSEQQAARTVAQQVLDIRVAFGLNMSQLAKALQVARVTVYEWMRQDSAPVLQEASRDRLTSLYRCALAWKAKPRIAGRHLQEFIPSLDTTVEKLLFADKLDAKAFQKAYTALMMAQSQPARKQAHQKHQIQKLDAAFDHILANADALGVVLD